MTPIASDSSSEQGHYRSGTVPSGGTTCMLFTGANVEGKLVVAHGFHKRGPRAGGPFILFDCALHPPRRVAALLFGSGATDDSTAELGALHAAHGGTLYFEAVHLLPADVQEALVPVIQERSAKRRHEHRMVPIDVWIMASSDVDLREEVAEGRFREDLFALLSTVSIEME